MKDGEEEVEKYLMEIATAVFTDVIHKYGSLLELNQEQSNLEKVDQFAMHPKNLVNFKQQGIVLFDFGIEGICADQILRADANYGFQAFVYSFSGRDKHEPIYHALDTLFQKIPAPNEFVLNINQPDKGYYYTKELSPLKAEDLCNAQFLTKHLRDPLVSVIEWYKKYSRQILAIEPKRFKRTKP